MNRKAIPNKKILEDMYSKDMTIKEIAECLDMAVGKVHAYFKKYNISTRPGGLKTEKAKIKFKNKMCGRPSPLKGTHLSEESKEKLSIVKSKGIGSKNISSTGYVRLYFPDHPKSDSFGYIFEHDLIMECAVGRWLQPNEVVHHKNGIKTDNRLKNLELLTRSEHMSLHRKERNDKNE